MTFDADLTACAQLVERADPDRFAATMALPVTARARLFPIWAFNVEVARAPWVTKEPLIAEMRLQWWRDALAEIATANTPRRHEVVTPLANILTPDMARALDALIAARNWDIHGQTFEDEADLCIYLDATTGTLLWVAALALGAPVSDEPGLRQAARAIALANWLTALPELEAHGKQPLHDGRPATLQNLARGALKDLAAQKSLSPASRRALLTGWRSRVILRTTIKTPARVAQGALVDAPILRSLTLIKARISGRI